MFIFMRKPLSIYRTWVEFFLLKRGSQIPKVRIVGKYVSSNFEMFVVILSWNWLFKGLQEIFERISPFSYVFELNLIAVNWCRIKHLSTCCRRIMFQIPTSEFTNVSCTNYIVGTLFCFTFSSVLTCMLFSLV